MYKVLMFGDRDWTKHGPIQREIRKLVTKHGVTDLLVIVGGARGADTISGNLAKLSNIHVAVVDALWDTRHGSAGPQRNKIMAALEPHEGIGFHEDIDNSKGTLDMYKRLLAEGIPVRIVKR